MDRLFSFLLFIAFSYQMIHNSHASNEALVGEPVRSRAPLRAREKSDD